MASVTQSIDVNVPVSTAYNQWTQFEEFPQFMDGVKQIRQLDDRTLEWTAEIGGQEENWTAEITEQEPDQRIAWHSITGNNNGGVVTFHHIDDNKTRVTLQMEWEPRGCDSSRQAPPSGRTIARSRATSSASRASSSHAVRRPARGAARSPRAAASARPFLRPSTCARRGQPARRALRLLMQS